LANATGDMLIRSSTFNLRNKATLINFQVGICEMINIAENLRYIRQGIGFGISDMNNE